MANIQVEYFAILREHAGRKTEAVDTNAGTAAELFDELNGRYHFPEMGQLKVAVNDEFSNWNAPISEGDFVVFIPPVAGG